MRAGWGCGGVGGGAGGRWAPMSATSHKLLLLQDKDGGCSRRRGAAEIAINQQFFCTEGSSSVQTNIY